MKTGLISVKVQFSYELRRLTDGINTDMVLNDKLDFDR
jgi:hypothetical protein